MTIDCAVIGTKILPKSPQDEPGRHQDEAKRRQDRAKSGQEAAREAKIRVFLFFVAFRAPQERPRVPQERPKSAQEPPREPQERPKRVRMGSQEGLKRVPRAVQEENGDFPKM